MEDQQKDDVNAENGKTDDDQVEKDGTKEKQTASAASSSTSVRNSSRSGNRRFQVLESQGFIVGKVLGQGSYASVRSVYDVKRKRKVAVKIISKRKAPEDFLTKFLPREVDVIKILKHDHLIAFYQVIETTTRYFLIMEIGKNDLLEEIRERKNVEENKAGVWFYQLHGGMMYMHSKGIVHRDLKCENVLLDEGQNIKITDFGFARKVVKNKTGEIKFSETYCGSYAYAAPEILKGIPYDPFTPDVWSIGVILFTMLYGRLPFDDSNHKKLLKQVQSRITFPAKPEVSEECRILILKMLNRASERVPLANIRYDPWYKKYLPSSLDVSELESLVERKSNSGSVTENPGNACEIKG